MPERRVTLQSSMTFWRDDCPYPQEWRNCCHCPQVEFCTIKGCLLGSTTETNACGSKGKELRMGRGRSWVAVQGNCNEGPNQPYRKLLSPMDLQSWPKLKGHTVTPAQCEVTECRAARGGGTTLGRAFNQEIPKKAENWRPFSSNIPSNYRKE